jgi:hypothetical protein
MPFKNFNPLNYFSFSMGLLSLALRGETSTNPPSLSELDQVPKPVQVAHIQLILSPNPTATEIELYQATLESCSSKKE